ncbi:hypothetical protein CLOM_g3892 [Closterium sp. NIES-68]|nr:hypothetical protein CLOM_g3892 [Closterium sp. NIES-68]GJP66821.1 hypothetical protein CLOP_g23716 [Closterium sp. NIES-67]
MARKSSARNWRDSATSPHSPSASLLLSTSALALSILAGAWLVPRQLWGADLTSNPLTCIKSTCALLLPVSLLLFSHPPFHSSLSLQPSPSPGRATPEQLIPRIATAIGLSYCGAVAAALIATAFGAPSALQSVSVTLHWSSLFSLLIVLPSALLFGANSHLWRSVLLRFSPVSLPEACVVTSAHGAVVGAWMGAWPMPLDWEQPWQAWPICSTYGMLLGYLIGLFLPLIAAWVLPATVVSRMLHRKVSTA